MMSNRGNTEIAKLLIEYEKTDINAKGQCGWTALMKATMEGHTEIVKLLLEQERIDVNAKDIFYFNNFLFQNNIWKLFKLFKTALIWASNRGYNEIVKLLLKQKGIDINVQDEDGNTALLTALSFFHKETAQLLLEQEGIDINAKNKRGWTALKIAETNKNFKEILDLLHKHT